MTSNSSSADMDDTEMVATLITIIAILTMLFTVVVQYKP